MNRLRCTLVVVLFAAASPIAAQPLGAWLIKGASNGHVSIPHDSAFNFTTGFTLEAWVQGTDSGDCSGIAGKGYKTTWWVGICGTKLRSYIKGLGSNVDGGTITNDWTHIAVTYDGNARKHYIDGELVKTSIETGPMTNNSSPVRINGDVDYNFAFGNIDEVRIWNVARTRDEIRANISKTINTAQPGLVAVYHLDGSPNDSVGGHNGSNVGTAAYFTSAVALTCGATTSTQLCLSGARFAVSSSFWVLSSDTHGIGKVVPGSSADSGNIWFFGPENWELLVKVLDGCPVNNHKWVFSAATTDQHYSLIVTDVKSGQTKRYFNYGGNAAPAITDTDAFATCP